MKINKNQALYRALPHCWTTYSDSKKSDYKYACEVRFWNTKRVTGINEEMIINDILRKVVSFNLAGGKVSEELSEENIQKIEFVEPSMNEGIADIVCSINPKTFYCQSCGQVQVKTRATEAPQCAKCRKKMNQLQMVYVCECGFADGVKPNEGGLFYHSKDQNNQYKFFTINNQKREMIKQCPFCNKILTPKNATDSRIFYSQSGNIVNLYNKNYAEAIKKYKNDAELLMLAKWFNLINDSDFNNALDDQKNFFEKKAKTVDDPLVVNLANGLHKTPEEIVSILNSQENVLNIDFYRSKINNNLPLSLFTEDEMQLITSSLLEFDTLKYPKSKITLDEAIIKAKNMNHLFDDNEINELCDIIGIKNIQISEAVQIVNYAYGYTRLRSCPDGSDATNSLTLRGFKNKVFTTILDTEGILCEIDMKKIFDWLKENDIISDVDIIDDEIIFKKWFIENIKLGTITHFSTISGNENKVTKIVYSLLHTISHMMIISCGKHSGLSRDSFSELIFPNTCSLFIYPTSSEGVTLGSISGMFETDLNLFLEDTLRDNEICTFDPICSNNQNGACVACAYLNEVNCTHFNKDLSRSYLYGGTIKINDEVIFIKKGFWR